MRFNPLRACAALPFAFLLSCGDSSTSPAPAPQASNGITVISPNGGETFQVGGALRVRFSVDTVNHPNLSSSKVWVSCGGEWGLLTGNGSIPDSRGDSTFAILDTIPKANNGGRIPFPTGSNCRVKVGDYFQEKTYFDTSDAVFAIHPKSSN